ncbi:MAG TPA: aminopeptidase N [Nocardioidaceae bacterium]|nr:aminopeptidase N [Nocardioidaceae bacterium]
MPSLTLVEAHERSASLSVSSYRVHLDLTVGDKTFRSRTSIEFRSSDRRDTFVDVQPEIMRSAELNGEPLDVGRLADGRLPLTGLGDVNTLVVDADMAYSHDGEGLHRAVDPEDGRAYVYAMTFLSAAPRIFACFDQPDLKAAFDISVKVPPEWTVLGNTRATQRVAGEWILDVTKPLSTYFVTLVAGPYHSITSTHDGIALGLHCRQSLARHLEADSDELFHLTGQCFDEYHRLFGIRYPFGDYHPAFVPEFNTGAMENPGCVTFSDEYVFKAQATQSTRASRAYVVAHEMAHMWFGDLVTMRWWDDLWLNESFATYMGYRVTSEVTSFRDIWTDFAFVEKAWGLAADQRSSTHPIAGNGARDTAQALTDFDGISYSKGSGVLRQLQAYLGDEAFLRGVVTHLHRHSFGNATLSDLLQSWQQATDKNVTAWAQDWLRTAGVDTLRCCVGSDGAVFVERANGSGEDVSRAHAFTATWYRDDETSVSTPVELHDSRTPVDLPYDGTGLLLPDSADETWAKVALDPTSASRAPRFLRSIEDPLSRAVIWRALRDGLYDATVSPGDYLAALEQSLVGESDLAVEKTLGSASGGAIGLIGVYFSPADDRRRLAAVAAEILSRSAPESNRQLIAARALVAASDDEQMLRSWLDGATPPGLRADDDLRWRITRALCEHGAYGLSDLKAEQERDPSSQGARHALRCRAAIPDRDVKAQVWDDITSNESLSNTELDALCEYFFRPGQDEVTGAFVPRYFTEIPATASLRTGAVVASVARLAYPRFAVSPETLRLSSRCLDDPSLPELARRSISDRTDDLRQAVASREKFGPTGRGR